MPEDLNPYQAPDVPIGATADEAPRFRIWLLPAGCLCGFGLMLIGLLVYAEASNRVLGRRGTIGSGPLSSPASTVYAASLMAAFCCIASGLALLYHNWRVAAVAFLAFLGLLFLSVCLIP